jgi:hypothetical protein
VRLHERSEPAAMARRWATWLRRLSRTATPKERPPKGLHDLEDLTGSRLLSHLTYLGLTPHSR